MSSTRRTQPHASDDDDRAVDPAVDRADLEMLLQRASRGDQDAWRGVIETYTPRVFGLIRAQCGSADLAEEITQSAFCTVVAKISSYTEVGRFEQWLFRIAMNRLRDEMRRRKRQARPMEDESLHAMADSQVNRSGASGAARSDGDSALAFGAPGRADPEQLKALRIALADLPDADQQIIHLRHNAGLSFKEIADILDQPLGTVLARQHRALKKLAEVLKPAEAAEPPVARARRAVSPPTDPRFVGRAGGSGGGGASGGGCADLDAAADAGVQPSGP